MFDTIRIPRLIFALFLGLGLVLAGCGEDENGVENGNGNGDLCEGVTCAADEICDPDTGECIPDPGLECHEDEDCNDPTLECRHNECVEKCEGVSCLPGEECDPYTGECVEEDNGNGEEDACELTPDSSHTVGDACEDNAPCDGGICAQFQDDAEPVCYQVCYPQECPEICSQLLGDDYGCVGVVDEHGQEIEDPDYGWLLGVCAEMPEGTQGAFERCGTEDTGYCETGSECLVVTGDEDYGTCLPECTGGAACPTVDDGGESFESVCAIETQDGSQFCVVLCETDGDCPYHTSCIDLGDGSVCMNE